MNSKPGLIWLERSISHLRDDKRTALDANDVNSVHAIKDAIKELEGLARSLKAEAYLGARKRRQEVRVLHERNETNLRLQNRLREVEGRFPAATLSLAA